MQADKNLVVREIFKVDDVVFVYLMASQLHVCMCMHNKYCSL